MPRKHFREIAHALRLNKPNTSQREAELFEKLVHAIGDACKRFNPRFQVDRFQRACGLESDR